MITLETGFVTGRVLRIILDGPDEGRIPDVVKAEGTVTFQSVTKITRQIGTAILVGGDFVTTFDFEGYIVDGQQQRGIFLPVGFYTVVYTLTNGTSPRSHVIEVTADHTEAAPLDLSTLIPEEGATPLTATEYAELSARLFSVENTPGTPAGGTTGQILAKVSNSDGDSTWVNPAVRMYGAESFPSYAYGPDSLAAGTEENLAIGGRTNLQAATTANRNVAVGSRVLESITTGSYNVAVGQRSLGALTTGGTNMGFGASSLGLLTTGSRNVAVGNTAGYGVLDTNDNIFIGYRAGYEAAMVTANASKGTGQTVIGTRAGQSSSAVANELVAIGHQATATTNATALGSYSKADHINSVALGQGSVTTATQQVMVGARDVEITDTTRGIIMKSPNGTRFRITVSDSGALVSTAVV